MEGAQVRADARTSLAVSAQARTAKKSIKKLGPKTVQTAQKTKKTMDLKARQS